MAALVRGVFIARLTRTGKSSFLQHSGFGVRRSYQRLFSKGFLGLQARVRPLPLLIATGGGYFGYNQYGQYKDRQLEKLGIEVQPRIANEFQTQNIFTISSNRRLFRGAIQLHLSTRRESNEHRKRVRVDVRRFRPPCSSAGATGEPTHGANNGGTGGPSQPSHRSRFRLQFPQLALRRRLGQLSCMSRPTVRLRSWPLSFLYYILPFGALKPLAKVGWRPTSR
ncbi:hypothetical protein cypCar_00028313, partial [Cyprinus carpio]